MLKSLRGYDKDILRGCMDVIVRRLKYFRKIISKWLLNPLWIFEIFLTRLLYSWKYFDIFQKNLYSVKDRALNNFREHSLLEHFEEKLNCQFVNARFMFPNKTFRTYLKNRTKDGEEWAYILKKTSSLGNQR